MYYDGWGGHFDRLSTSVDSVWEQEKLEARLREMLAADWASELQANVAQPKRMDAGHPHRPLHIILVLVQDALLGSF